MPTFAFRARDGRGAVVAGTVEAPDQIEALRRLRSEGKTVTDIREGSAPVNVNALLARQAARRVSPDEVVAFSAQMAVMLQTGVPLADAMRAYLKQSRRAGGLPRVIDTVSTRINGGASFSTSIADFPRVFPSLAVSLIKASEATGRLGEMLGRVAEYIGKERDTRRQVKGALMYPAVMLTMALSVTTFLVLWVLPKFAKIYDSRAAALPRPTRMLLDFSGAVMSNWLGLALAGAALAAGLWFSARSARGRRAIDWMKVRLPVIGPVYANFYLTRAARTLGTLLGGGITLLEAIRIVRGVTDNCQWSDLWDQMEQSLRAGGGLSDVVVDSPLIPPAAAQMIAAGERSGRLPDVLARIADQSEKQFDVVIKAATQMIEPAVITVMGLMIGGIAIALLLPIFTIGNVIAH